MGWKFDNLRLSELLKQKRLDEQLGLRDIAARNKVSPSTMSRVERGETPDMATFLLLVEWLERRPELFFMDTLETEAAGFAQKAQKFRQVMTLLTELGLTSEQVSALQTIIAGLLPPLSENPEGEAVAEPSLLTHYFTATFHIEANVPHKVGLSFVAKESEADRYSLVLLAHAQSSLPASLKVKGAAFATQLYPVQGVDYLEVEARENERGEPVVIHRQRRGDSGQPAGVRKVGR